MLTTSAWRSGARSSRHRRTRSRRRAAADLGGREPDVMITADVVDFCRRVGDRLAPGELTCEIDGDATLAADLLAAAPAFATL